VRNYFLDTIINKENMKCKSAILFIFFTFSFSNLEIRTPGDINNDGIVDILDLVELVNIILGNSNNIENADLNGDGIINIVDIVETVNIILFNNEFNENAFGSPQSFDLLTWNIEHFPKHNNTIDELTNIIPLLEVDIIALQEIEDTESLETLKNNLGDNWFFYRSDSNSNYGTLSYLINTNEIEITQSPYTILSQYDYEFAWRRPYVLKIKHNNIDYTIINIHYKCCDGSESRRLEASIVLENYISNYLNNDNVILLGDFNDLLIDSPNIFDPFLDESNDYIFTDMEIASGSPAYWSYPGWPSHLDHILITNELFNSSHDTQTILIEDSFFPNNSNLYDYYISDHRPVGIRIQN